MNNFTYENQGTNTYLVYSVEQDDIVDSLGLGMLTNNRIPGIASTIFIQMDEKKFIKYNVSAKVSVKQFFASPVNQKRLLGVFNGIVNAMMAAEEYMLDPRDILLDTEYIFTDVSTCETVMICLPVEGYKSGEKNLSSFFKNIMFSTAFDQTENCDYVAKIINYLNSAPTFSLVEFKNVLNDIKKESGLTGNTANQPRTVVLPSALSEASLVKMQQTNNSVNNQKSSVQMGNNNQPISGHGMVVTPVQPKSNVVQPSANIKNSSNMQIDGQNNEPKKTITMFELLSHYNKENAALYKAQKNAKKAQKQQKKNPSANNVPNNNFSVPGQTPKLQNPSGTNFAVPGQVPPGPGNNFAIPGQVAPLPASKVNIQQETPKQVAMPVGGAQKGMVQPGIQPNMAQPGIQSNMAQPGMQPNMVQPGMQPNMVQPGMQPNMMNQAPVNFGETSVLGSNTIGQTTVLNSAQLGAPVMKPYLVRKKNDEKIMIDKPVFRIGKEKSYVDYFISDNTAISRSHANIISRENEYYIIDTNSTNHTYINGTMIGSNSEMKLTNGDKVRLANEEFEFKFF